MHVRRPEFFESLKICQNKNISKVSRGSKTNCLAVTQLSENIWEKMLQRLKKCLRDLKKKTVKKDINKFK